MASTGTPSVCSLNAARLLPTPEPGTIPESASCTVVQTRSGSRAASASTTSTICGRTLSAAPRTSSTLSTPVVPSTPGCTALTSRNPSSPASLADFRCRVTIRLRSVSGPTASGVTASLPRPATSTLSHPAVRRRSSAASAYAERAKALRSRRASAPSSSVRYVPTGLRSCRAPFSSRIFTTVVRMPRRSFVLAQTPESSVCSPALRRQSSCSSIARSVLAYIYCHLARSLPPYLAAYAKIFCKNMKKGIDFMKRTRYNVFLHGNVVLTFRQKRYWRRCSHAQH